MSRQQVRQLAARRSWADPCREKGRGHQVRKPDAPSKRRTAQSRRFFGRVSMMSVAHDRLQRYDFSLFPGVHSCGRWVVCPTLARVWVWTLGQRRFPVQTKSFERHHRTLSRGKEGEKTRGRRVRKPNAPSTRRTAQSRRVSERVSMKSIVHDRLQRYDFSHFGRSAAPVFPSVRRPDGPL